MSVTSPRPSLPPEISDDILDFFKPSYAETPDRERVLTLVACAQVCSAWLPRARVYLYASVWVTEGKAMLGLASTISVQPTLAPLIKRIVARGPAAKSYQSRNLPLLGLLQNLPKLQELVVDSTAWSLHYPLSQTARLGRRTSITRLVLHSIYFRSPSELLHLVFSFDALVELTLCKVVCDRTHAELTVDQLHARRPHWAAPSLRVLDIRQANSRAFAALPLLGPGLHRLSFQTVFYKGLDSTIDGKSNIGLCIALNPDLRVLSLTLGSQLYRKWPRHRAGLDPPDPGSFTEVVSHLKARLVDRISAYERVHSCVAYLLTAVRSPKLHTLSLSFDLHTAALTPMDELVASPEYMCKRTDFLDVIFSRVVRRTLLEGPMFANLSALSFGIHEDAPDVYGEEWWRAQVQSRLQRPRAGKVDVTIRFIAYEDQDNVLVPFWEPERFPTIPRTLDDA